MILCCGLNPCSPSRCNARRSSAWGHISSPVSVCPKYISAFVQNVHVSTDSARRKQKPSCTAKAKVDASFVLASATKPQVSAGRTEPERRNDCSTTRHGFCTQTLTAWLYPSCQLSHISRVQFQKFRYDGYRQRHRGSSIRVQPINPGSVAAITTSQMGRASSVGSPRNILHPSKNNSDVRASSMYFHRFSLF